VAPLNTFVYSEMCVCIGHV